MLQLINLILTHHTLHNNFYFQALAFIPPIRNYFLRDENYKDIKRPPGDMMFPFGKSHHCIH